MMRTLVLKGLVLVLVLGLQACATVKNPDPRDPMESFNRSVYSFNDGLDKAVLKPVATAYQAVTPSWVRTGVGNFFNNIGDVWSAVNHGLQGRGQAMGDNIGRVMVNTSLGLFGLIDIATDLNIERQTADFGLTLGRWGVGTGPYVVLPLLGPSTLRGVGALPVDWSADFVTGSAEPETATGLTVLKIVDTRAKYLRAGELVEGAALDPYSFVRDAYLQRLRNKQYDGNPPEEPSEP